MLAVIDVMIDDGTTYRVKKDDFVGRPRNTMSWTDVEEKFETMTHVRRGPSRGDRRGRPRARGPRRCRSDRSARLTATTNR